MNEEGEFLVDVLPLCEKCSIMCIYDMFRMFGDEPKNLISQNANFVRTEETRMLELQKASVWKRASAALFDFILLATLSVGVALLLSLVLGYNNYSREFEAVTQSYESAYGVEEYNQV